MPLCRNYLLANDNSTLLKGCPVPTIQVMRSVIGRILLSFSLKKHSGEISHLYVGSLYYLLSTQVHELLLALYKLDFSELIIKLKSGEIEIRKDLLDHYYYNYWPPNYWPPGTGEFIEISIHQIIDENILVSKLKEISEIILPIIYDRWEKAYQYNHRQQSINIVDQISVNFLNVK
jgi:hypothetical protein